MKKAGILTIGNEILQGYTFNLNVNTISQELTKRNINVTIHLTVPDSVEKISEKIGKFIQKDYDYVFVTGGLGPTHDDVTKEALLELFDEKLVFLEDRHKILEKKYLKKSQHRESRNERNPRISYSKIPRQNISYQKSKKIENKVTDACQAPEQTQNYILKVAKLPLCQIGKRLGIQFCRN